MSESTGTGQHTPKCILKLIDLNKQEDFDELLRQRILCGWDKEAPVLEGWRQTMNENKNPWFWIYLPNADRPIGHIALKTELDPPEPSVAHLNSLFVLPDFRSGGIGRAAVEAVEAMAKVEPYGSPDCKAITLNAISRRYTEDDSDEWLGLYSTICASLGIKPAPKGRSNEDWYTRMGYVKWKEEPTYPHRLPDGTEIKLMAAHLRKNIKPST